MILNVVISPSRQQLGNLWPSVTQLLVCFNYHVIFFFCPLVFLDIRIQVIMPSVIITIMNYTFIYLSLHCLPILPGNAVAIWLQFYGPYFITMSSNIWSSSSVQGPFIMAGFSTFYHLWRHWTSVLLSKNEAILFQFFAPYYSTRFLSFSSWIIT